MLVPKFLDSAQEKGRRLSMVNVRVQLGACLLTPSPPGILYDPNMIEEQNEQRKLLPKRIQEHASALCVCFSVFVGIPIYEFG